MPDTFIHCWPVWIANFGGKQAIKCFHGHMTYNIGLWKQRSRVHDEEIDEQMSDEDRSSLLLVLRTVVAAAEQTQEYVNVEDPAVWTWLEIHANHTEHVLMYTCCWLLCTRSVDPKNTSR